MCLPQQGAKGFSFFSSHLVFEKKTYNKFPFKVAVVDLSGDGAQQVANDICAKGGDAFAIQADVLTGFTFPFLFVSKIETERKNKKENSEYQFSFETKLNSFSQNGDVLRMIEETEKKYGLVNVVFNNAGWGKKETKKMKFDTTQKKKKMSLTFSFFQESLMQMMMMRSTRLKMSGI